MRSDFLYSALLHIAVLFAFFHHLSSSSLPRGSFYTIDLAVQNFPSSADLEASNAQADIMTPAANEDYLAVPSHAKKPKPRLLPASVKPPQPNPKLNDKSGINGGSSRALVGVQGGVGTFSFPFYAGVIQKKITINWNSDFWKKGLLARRAEVAFNIHRDGLISDPQFAEKSGDSYFDSTCLRAVILAAPFPPLPEGFAGEQLRIVFSFEITAQ